MGSFGAGPPQASSDAEFAFRQNISPVVADIDTFHRWMILTGLGLVTAIEISNRISINVLLPDLQGNVAADSDQVSWVLILYNIGFLCSIALSSWFARILGAKRHFLCAILLYTLGALGCLFNPHNLTRLLLARSIMGFGGGAFLVRVVTLVGILFPGKARIAAVTWLYFLLSAFQIAYPIAMGAINDAFHWNYAFLLDMPFLAISSVLIWKYLPAGHLSLSYLRNRLDLWGAGFLIGGLVLLQAALSRGERDLWFETPWISVALLSSILFLFLFVWWECRGQNRSPVLHLRRIYQVHSLRASFLIILLVGGILGSSLFILPQYLRFVQNYSALQTGEFISLYSLGTGIGLTLSLRIIIPRIGAPWTLAAGLCSLGTVFVTYIYLWTPDTPGVFLGATLLFQGLFLGLVLISAANVVASQFGLTELSEGETSYFFVRQLGNTLGVTATTVIFDHRMTLHSSRLLDVANRLYPAAQSTLAQYRALISRNGGGAGIPDLGALQIFQNNVIKQSRLLSYIDISFYLVLLCAAGIICVALARARRSKIAHHLHCLS
jgi:DHA2 family multidrug resistance protein